MLELTDAFRDVKGSRHFSRPLILTLDTRTLGSFVLISPALAEVTRSCDVVEVCPSAALDW